MVGPTPYFYGEDIGAMMLQFPYSKIIEFNQLVVEKGDNRRTGQRFHQFMELEKSRQYKNDCDMIYELDGKSFWRYIEKHVNHDC